jgi:7-cyano-7-deazaguanine synthase
MTKVIVAHSGGVDSTVLVYDQLASGSEVVGFGVDYGQRHRRELEAAKAICADLGVEYLTASVAGPFGGSELTDGRGGVVVPNRNMVLIALAGAAAVSLGAGYVAVGCHKGDHDLFPDCRPVFMEHMWSALRKGADGVRLLTPYVTLTKLEVVSRGVELGVPFDRTWSCYRGGEAPCGECLACRERHQALYLLGVA